MNPAELGLWLERPGLTPVDQRRAANEFCGPPYPAPSGWMPLPLSAPPSIRLVSVQTGRIQTLEDPSAADPAARRWTTAFFKTPAAGPVRVRAEGLEGDAQADRRFHGGLEKAVLAYSAEHYPLWRAELNEPAMGPGGFGENLTLSGADEETVHIGDVWILGEVRLIVTQPRQPCVKLGRRWGRPALVQAVKENGRSGWYLKVEREGVIEAGMAAVPAARPHPDWPVRRAQRAMDGRRRNRAEALALAELPELSADWREALLSG